MEMKANVASAIKEMMAQMNSTGVDSSVDKKDETIKTDNNDNNTVLSDSILAVKKEGSDAQPAEKADEKVNEPVNKPLSFKDELKEKSGEANVSKDEHEVKKTFGTFIPTPYGKDVRSSVASSIGDTVAEKTSEEEKAVEEKPVFNAAPAFTPSTPVEAPVSKQEVSAPKAAAFTPAPSFENAAKPISSPTFSVTPNPSATAYEKTVIANGTVINGNISCAGSMELSGEVIGNVTVNGELKVWGRIEGDIITSALSVLGGKVKGNIDVAGKVNLDTASVVAGNVRATELSLEGKLKGDVDIEGAVIIGSTGVQIGKISARQLSIGQGAKLNSTIQMTNADATAIAEEIFA